MKQVGPARWTVALAIAALVTVALLGVGSEALASVRVGYAADRQEDLAVLTELKRSFEQTAPGVLVELVPLDLSNPGRLLQWFYTGSAADLFLLPVHSVSFLKGTGALMSFTGSRWHGLEQRLFNFPPGLRLAYSEERGPIGVPVTADVALFQYNNTMMQNAGVPPLSQLGEAWSWHEMIEVGRRVSLPEQRRYLVDIDFEFVAVYFLAHGDAIGPDGRPNLLNEINVGLLGLASRAINEDRISPPLAQQNERTGRFRRGVLGMRRQSISDMLPGALDRDWLQAGFEWDVVPLPVSPYTFRRPAFGEGSGLVAAQGAPVSPELVTFLEWVASLEGQQAVMRSASAFPASPLLWDQAMFYARAPHKTAPLSCRRSRSGRSLLFPRRPRPISTGSSGRWRRSSREISILSRD